MVWYSNGGLKTWLNKPVFGPKCPVFYWSAKSHDFSMWIPDTSIQMNPRFKWLLYCCSFSVCQGSSTGKSSRHGVQRSTEKIRPKTRWRRYIFRTDSKSAIPSKGLFIDQVKHWGLFITRCPVGNRTCVLGPAKPAHFRSGGGGGPYCFYWQ